MFQRCLGGCAHCCAWGLVDWFLLAEHLVGFLYNLDRFLYFILFFVNTDRGLLESPCLSKFVSSWEVWRLLSLPAAWLSLAGVPTSGLCEVSSQLCCLGSDVPLCASTPAAPGFLWGLACCLLASAFLQCFYFVLLHTNFLQAHNIQLHHAS